MKIPLYIIYTIIFYLCSLIPINPNKTTFIMTHDESINGNIMRMYYKIKSLRPNEICQFVTKKQINQEVGCRRFIKKIIFVFSSSFHLATSNTIFLDNVFLPMAFMCFKKKVKIVQLWHGCNTLKKFGQLSNTGILKWLEKKANSRYTHLITSSTKMNHIHQEAFGVKEDKIYALGLPRLDSFFEKEEVLKKEKEIFYRDYEHLRNKKIILYAPTFRDSDLSLKDIGLNLEEVADRLPNEYILLTRFHPFVSQHYKGKDSNKLVDVSRYKDLNRLLLVADILITDYSSIIFEYVLLNKPLIFYAYDEELYSQKIRGFYYEYEQYVPGVIVKSKEDLLNCIRMESYLDYNYEKFIEGYIDYRDTQAADRIYNVVYK